MIKLGQFLSTRVDVLPSVVTDELKGLQDEVPSESLADIRALIAAEFGRPVEQVFSCFEPVPEAAASLAQVHRACLMDGANVVVKVQRPRIERLVATDLAAIRLALRWLKWYRPIARRVDLDHSTPSSRPPPAPSWTSLQKGTTLTVSPPTSRTIPASTSRMFSGSTPLAAC